MTKSKKNPQIISKRTASPDETPDIIEFAASGSNYDPDGSIHEAVLAAKEKHGTKLKKPGSGRRGKATGKLRMLFTSELILEWADAYFAANGRWPHIHAGKVKAAGAGGVSWNTVHRSLLSGYRSFPGGSSLLKFIREHRGPLSARGKELFNEEQILLWADNYRAATGDWPRVQSGIIYPGATVTWTAINSALQDGVRGLPGGQSLHSLLRVKRGAKRYTTPPTPWRITIEMILDLSDNYHADHGVWPTANSGSLDVGISGHDLRNWYAVDSALRIGMRGLPGGYSLYKLLYDRRGALAATAKPPLTEQRILEWADHYYASTGYWPRILSGLASPETGDTWNRVDRALKQGNRGLPGGSSLSRLLYEQRRAIAKKPKRPERADITEGMILDWADLYHKSTGEWPTRDSGPIEDCAPETWRIVEEALSRGKRGLPHGGSLYKLFRAHRGIPPVNRSPPPRPPLTEQVILTWADQFHAAMGMWPKKYSGAISGTAKESWAGVNKALSKGLRGLAGGTTLCGLLARERGTFSNKARSVLSVRQILEWADLFHESTGTWPTQLSGRVATNSQPPESWRAIHQALTDGLRGLPGNGSLARLICEHRGFAGTRAIVRPTLPPQLTVERILEYADQFHASTGSWPGRQSGTIVKEGRPVERWSALDKALLNGSRGLPGGSSLTKILYEHRAVQSVWLIGEVTEEQVLDYADSWKAAHGRWPGQKDGPVNEGSSITWRAISKWLCYGKHGLPGGSTIGRLIQEHRGE